MIFKIALNAGHGLYTAGKRCLKSIDPNTTREWTLNNRICDKIEEKLKAYAGYELIRLDDTTGEKNIALATRVNSANAFKADFYLSIHHNAGIKGGNGGGIMAFTYTSVSAATLEWQEALYNALIKHTGLKGNRSTPLAKANFYECRKSAMPCVLLECGYMDSTTDTPIILTEDFAEGVAIACVEVLVEKGKLTKKATETAPQPTKSTNKVLEWQKAAVADGFKFPKYGTDGKWGSECIKVATEALCKKRITYKYKNLTKIVQKAVGATVDGKYGNDTVNFVKAYQSRYGLTADGVVGLNTWKKILNV